jgi:hypothetical protein
VEIKFPLTYFGSEAAPNGGSMVIHFSDSKQSPFTLVLDREPGTITHNQFFIDGVNQLSSEDEFIWLDELIRIKQATQFEYKTEADLISLFIQVIESH